MRKILVIILLLVFTSSLVFANNQIGDKIADVLYTDIVTEINGQEVKSFNINGSTAIYVSEVKKLGYNVKWDGDNRLVRIINDETNNPSYIEKKLTSSGNNNNQIGDKINDVLYTDIRTKINGKEVESFNINGSTAIYVTPLQETGATVNWNGEKRRLSIFNINNEETEKIIESNNAEEKNNESFKFRENQWGDTIDNVINAEGQPDYRNVDKDIEGIIYSNKDVAEYNTYLTYMFKNSYLYAGSYGIDEDYSRDEKYIEEYKSLKEKLIKKYGQPDIDEVIWYDDLWKDDYNDWGMALQTGELEYISRWNIDNTRIQLKLHGGNFEIDFMLLYGDMNVIKNLNNDNNSEGL